MSSRAKFIMELINRNENAIIEESGQLDEQNIYDFFQHNDQLYDSAPPSTSIQPPSMTPKINLSNINPPHSAPLLTETCYDNVLSVENCVSEQNLSCKRGLDPFEVQKCNESINSEISGIGELSSSPIRVFSDSSVSWFPDSEEDKYIKKKRRVFVAGSSSESDSEESRTILRSSEIINLKKNVNNDTIDCQKSSDNLVLDTDTLEINGKTSRWKKCDTSKWKKNVAKCNKENGLPYLSKKDNIMPPKQPKPVNCFVKCRYQCQNNFSDDERIKICRTYWKISDFIAKKQFLIQNVVAQPLKSMKIGSPRRKNRTAAYKYYFNKNDHKIRVCKDFFLKTLCISNGPVNEAFKHRDELGIYTGKDGRGSRVPMNKTSLEMEQKVVDHINSFPRLESHYCRKKSQRQYLDSKLTIAKMYELYKEQQTRPNEEPCSLYVYKKIFGTKFNLSFFTPKKDLCITCTRYDSSGRPENLKENYESHISRKNEAQQAKELDKQRSMIDDSYLVVTSDMQSTLHIPISGVGILYYTRKLNVQNYTIYSSKSPHEAFCITWNEINGKRGSVEIASAIDWWITRIPKHIKEITMYSDTCAGQNRNQFITAYFVHLIQRADVSIEVIEQKYLESGHTHMEVDSMHSAIEREQRHTPVYSMIDWKLIMERARSKRNRDSAPPYVVKELHYSEMLDVRQLNEKIVKNTSKDGNGNIIKWLKIKCLRFERKCPGLVKFRYEHNGPYLEFNILEAHTIITRRKRRQDGQNNNYVQTTEELLEALKTYKIPQANSAPLPISDAKKKDLINLCAKGIIPRELHLWYQSLPTSKDKIDRLLEPDAREEEEDELVE